MEKLNWLAEYAAFGLMLGLTTVVGLYYGCGKAKQNTINDYLLGGKEMSVFPITMSLIARYTLKNDFCCWEKGIEEIKNKKKNLT